MATGIPVPKKKDSSGGKNLNQHWVVQEAEQRRLAEMNSTATRSQQQGYYENGQQPIYSNESFGKKLVMRKTPLLTKVRQCCFFLFQRPLCPPPPPAPARPPLPPPPLTMAAEAPHTHQRAFTQTWGSSSNRAPRSPCTQRTTRSSSSSSPRSPLGSPRNSRSSSSNNSSPTGCSAFRGRRSARIARRSWVRRLNLFCVCEL